MNEDDCTQRPGRWPPNWLPPWLPSPWVVAVVLAALISITVVAAWPRARASSPDPHASTQVEAGKQLEQAELALNSGEVDSVVIHVIGAVKQPGLVKIPAPARVYDAIAAAGGPLDQADLASVNLARILQDGEQIRICARDECSTIAANSSSPSGGVLERLNRADQSGLSDLPGIGPALAARIIADRNSNGPYRDISEITRVPGIGASLVAKLKAVQ